MLGLPVLTGGSGGFARFLVQLLVICGLILLAQD
jgi:hypothetical protein